MSKERPHLPYVKTLLIALGAFVVTYAAQEGVKALQASYTGEPYSFAIAPQEFAVAALFAILALVVSADIFSRRAADSVAKLAESVKESRNVLDDIQRACVDLKAVVGLEVQACASFLNALVRTKLIQDPTKWRGEHAATALQALGNNIAAWDQHAFKNRSGAADTHERLWLSHASTYFTEESFDIRRGELVTNGRNYTLLRIGTIAALLDAARQQDKCVYAYLVSPMNPKDWYNTPYGRRRPRCYNDEGFPNLFHRCLTELRRSCKSDELVTETIVLASDGEQDHDCGWIPDRVEKLAGDLAGHFVLPVSVSPAGLRSGPGGKRDAIPRFADLLASYYELSNNRYNRCEEADAVRFIPMVGTHWPERIAEILKGDGAGDVGNIQKLQVLARQLADEIQSGGARASAEYLRECAKTEAFTEIRNLKGRLGLNERPQDGELRTLNDIVDMQIKYPESEWSDFGRALGVFHRASQEMASAALSGGDAVHKLLLSVLRFREAHSAPDDFEQLAECFSVRMHGHRLYAKVAKVKPPKSRKLGSAGFGGRQESAFMVFGLGAKASREFPDLDFSVVITADLHYPYDAVTVRFVDDHDQVADYKERLHTHWSRGAAIHDFCASRER